MNRYLRLAVQALLSLSFCSSLGFRDVSENWETQVLSSSLSLVDTSNNTGTIFDRLLSVESSLKM